MNQANKKCLICNKEAMKCTFKKKNKNQIFNYCPEHAKKYNFCVKCGSYNTQCKCKLFHINTILGV